MIFPIPNTSDTYLSQRREAYNRLAENRQERAGEAPQRQETAEDILSLSIGSFSPDQLSTMLPQTQASFEHRRARSGETSQPQQNPPTSQHNNTHHPNIEKNIYGYPIGESFDSGDTPPEYMSSDEITQPDQEYVREVLAEFIRSTSSSSSSESDNDSTSSTGTTIVHSDNED